jgi:CO dehydrogenase maturation factor
MGQVIAIAGKGGTGKTTITALLVRLLKEINKGPILAVDADPNSNLAENLGVKIDRTIGEIIDGIASGADPVPAGVTKDRAIQYRVQTAIKEGDGFDLLSMGRPEGAGCYCYANTVLRGIISDLVNEYKYIIIDNEAGLEHLSRRTTRQADVLLAVTDPTQVGLRSCVRISELADELKIEIKRRFFIINKANLNETYNFNCRGMEYLGKIPLDLNILTLAFSGDSLFSLADNSISITELRKIGEKIWQIN